MTVQATEPTNGPTNTAPAGAKPSAPATAQQTAQGEPADLGDAGKKALDAERSARKAAEDSAKELQKQLDAINQANETAVEKAQREAAEAAKNAQAATVTAFREAAVKFGGISAEDAELFLTGSDQATLTKQAERLMERTSTGPKPDLTQGGKATPASGTPEQDFANFLNGQMGS